MLQQRGERALIDELQFTLGEGPCVDAYQTDRPVSEPDLAAPTTTRWLTLTPPAVEAGARAIFGFPSRWEASGFAPSTSTATGRGSLSDEQYVDALVLAGVAARTVLAMQAQAPPGS